MMEEDRPLDPGQVLFECEPAPHHETIEEILEVAVAFHKDGDVEKAAEIYRSVLECVPDNSQANFNLATIFHSCGDTGSAISCYENVLVQDQENFQVLYYLAGAYRDQGYLEKSVSAYRRAMGSNPEHADACYNLGVVHQLMDEPILAASCYQKAVALDPEHSRAFYNLGVISYESGKDDAAAEYYQRAIDLSPEDVDAHYNLALVHIRSGRLKDGVVSYVKALELSPEDAFLHNSLGLLWKKLNALDEAESCFRNAVRLKPDFGAAYTNLAVISHTKEQYDDAIEFYSMAVELGYQTEIADHMIAALTGSTRTSMPENYARDLFDSYAEGFDESLVGDLEYKTPASLRKTVVGLAGEGCRYERVLDLGCGTGLAGKEFRKHSETLVGIDVSSKMLEKAAQKRLYDSLHCSEIVDYLAATEDRYDLIIAADVLNYIGELDRVFHYIGKCLDEGGLFAFSIEKLEREGGCRLQKSGRYAHSREFVEDHFRRTGLKLIVCRDSNVRKDRGEWIKGLLFILHKPLQIV